MGFATRYIVLPLMIFSIVGSTLMVPLVLLDFEIRKDYIAKVLCIERNKTRNTCIGSCYLSQQLEKTTHHSSDDKSVINPELNFSFFHQKIESMLFSSQSHNLDLAPVSYQRRSIAGPMIFDIFHPPRS
jgi:hypothetical protein